MASRSYATDAVVLRSIRFGEADRVLHLYTAERGRIGAVAKGVRKTKSRFGARLEPLSHVELELHQGSGELQTITGVQLRRSHQAARDDYYRLSVGLIGAEAMLRLFTEQERNERAFVALTRFLDDGRLEIDNNIAERAMRCVALGRKNWLFAGSKAGGDRAAAIYSVIETAKLNGLEPQAYAQLARKGQVAVCRNVCTPANNTLSSTQ